MTTTPRTAPGLARPRSRPSAVGPGPRCRDTRTSRATRPCARQTAAGLTHPCSCLTAGRGAQDRETRTGRATRWTAAGLAHSSPRPPAVGCRPGLRCGEAGTGRATTGLTRPGGRRAAAGQGLDSWRES